MEQLGPVLHLETVIEQAQLFFYGDFCHIQLLGDFLVGPAFFHPLDHQFFPGTEDFFLQRTAFCRGEGIGMDHLQEIGEFRLLDGFHQHGTQQGLVLHKGQVQLVFQGFC